MTDQSNGVFCSVFGAVVFITCLLAVPMNSATAQYPKNIRYPQTGNRLLQAQRDQVANALGESHPRVLSLNARCGLEGIARPSVAGLGWAKAPSPEMQLRRVVKEFNSLLRQNRQVEELKAQLRQYNGEGDSTGVSGQQN